MKHLSLIPGLLCLFMVQACKSKVAEREELSIKEIKRTAVNNQTVSSKGIITGRTAKRAFIVEDGGAVINILIPTFKADAKYMKEGSKVVFSGRYVKKPFRKGVVEVTSFKVVEDFK